MLTVIENRVISLYAELIYVCKQVNNCSEYKSRNNAVFGRYCSKSHVLLCSTLAFFSFHGRASGNSNVERCYYGYHWGIVCRELHLNKYMFFKCYSSFETQLKKTVLNFGE